MNPTNIDKLREKLEKAVDVCLNSPETLDLDLDELIELIDFAVDEGQLTKAWTLMIGAQRLYPANDLLKCRLSYIIYQEGDNEMASRLIATFAPDDPWASTMRLLMSGDVSPEHMSRSLSDIINNAEVLDQAMAYNLLEAAKQTGCTDIIKASEAKIIAKCDDPVTFRLDLIDLSKDLHDDAWTKRLIDELEQDQPFSPDMWEEKALYQLNVEYDPEEALQSVEYSLAIEPDSEQGLSVKGLALAAIMAVSGEKTDGDDEKEAQPDPEKIAAYRDHMLKAIGLYPDSITLLTDYFNVYVDQPAVRDKLGSAPFADYFRHHCDQQLAVEMFVMVLEMEGRTDEISKALDIYFAAGPDTDEAAVIEWSEKCRRVDCLHTAMEILSAYLRRRPTALGQLENRTPFLEMFYLRGEYDKVIEVMEGDSLSESDDEWSPASDEFIKNSIIDHYIEMLAACRLGDKYRLTVCWLKISCAVSLPRFMASAADKMSVHLALTAGHILGEAANAGTLTEKTIDSTDIFLADSMRLRNKN